MQANEPAPPFSLAPLLPPALRSWAAPLEPALCKLFIPDEVMLGVEQARRSGAGAQFAARLLESLGIRFVVEQEDRDRLPVRGPVVVMANHPFGIVDGLVAAVMLESIRPDWKILANSMLGALPELSERMILVNPFDTPQARKENRAPLRRAIEWLSGGGLLFTFPAGEVAHLNLKEQSVTDPLWNTTSTRLALRAGCPVSPMFFEGCNSVPFQLAGVLHPRLRTMGLAREFHKMRGKTVRLRIGTPIPHAVLDAYQDPGRATEYLRSRTYFLANRSESVRTPFCDSKPVQRVRAIVPDGMERLISEEVASLPPECELAGNNGMSVYVAEANQLLRMLPEIGRCREIAFRAAGEGTGAEVDLDRFDKYYQHLFLWDKSAKRLAGAYRLAVTTEVLRTHGVRGLYTSTLFRFDPRFFERMGPAMELGRSFILPEYQKNYASLLLLWKGIVRLVMRRPEAPMLFGAVSISRDYHDASRSLIAAYLKRSASHELAALVHPRRKFRSPALGNAEIRRMVSCAADLDDVSRSIADIERDAKGVPVLLRQYLKTGGRVLGFNVDPAFGEVLDALLLADLRFAPPALLGRCAGRSQAQSFVEQAKPAR